MTYALKRSILSLALAGSVLAISGVSAGPALSNCGTPCFADNDDILAGQRQLLPVDDLIYTSRPIGKDNVINTTILTTNNLALSDEEMTPVVTNGCSVTPAVANPVQTRVGRLWPLINDVIITLATTSAANGANCTVAGGGDNLALYILDRINSANDSTTDFRAGAVWAQLALGDFDRDGL